MTATPAYGFRIRGGRQPGPMQQAIGAGNVADIQNLLTKRFPGLQFEALEGETEEVEKPEATASQQTVLASGLLEEPGEEVTTESLYGDYVQGLPGGVRGLVTTDYKGVRGGRLGRGNYSTASIIPGAQVSAPAPITAPSTAAYPATYPAPSYSSTTYNYTYNYPQEQAEVQPIAEPSEEDATSPTPTTGGGFTPAWAKATSQKKTTAKKAGAGKVASTTTRGAYVAPSSAAAPATAQRAAAAVSQAVARGGSGVQAAARAGGDSGKIGANAAAALVAGGGRSSAKQALKKASKGKVQLTNQARKALQKAAKKK